MLERKVFIFLQNLMRIIHHVFHNNTLHFSDSSERQWAFLLTQPANNSRNICRWRTSDNTNQSRNFERVEGRKKHPKMRLFQESTHSRKSSSGVNTQNSVKWGGRRSARRIQRGRVTGVGPGKVEKVWQRWWYWRRRKRRRREKGGGMEQRGGVGWWGRLGQWWGVGWRAAIQWDR